MIHVATIDNQEVCFHINRKYNQNKKKSIRIGAKYSETYMNVYNFKSFNRKIHLLSISQA